MKFKALAAAVALMSSATVANAAWHDGWEGSGNFDGELLLVAFDETLQVSVIQDLGGSTQEFINNVSNGSFTQSYALDPLFASTFASSNAADIRWAVYANSYDIQDSSVNTFLSTSNDMNMNATIDEFFAHQDKIGAGLSINVNANLPNGLAGNFAENGAFYGDSVNGLYAGDTGIYNRNIMNTVTFDATASANESLYFWAINADLLVNFDTTRDQFVGQWVLDLAGGTLAYNPVPVPAAIWLLASGLLGLGAVSRRRKA